MAGKYIMRNAEFDEVNYGTLQRREIIPHFIHDNSASRKQILELTALKDNDFTTASRIIVINFVVNCTNPCRSNMQPLKYDISMQLLQIGISRIAKKKRPKMPPSTVRDEF